MSSPANGPERLVPRPGPKFNGHDIQAYRRLWTSAHAPASRFPEAVYVRDGDAPGEAIDRYIGSAIRSISTFDLPSMIELAERRGNYATARTLLREKARRWQFVQNSFAAPEGGRR